MLDVDSRPWTNVSVDGTTYGATPIKDISLAAGVHTVVMSNPAFNLRLKKKVKVRPGQTLRLRERFAKGFLQVLVKPFGDVYVNGRHKGLTPLDEPLSVYEGTHTLRVTCKRTGKEKTQKVRIRAGQTNKVILDLR